MQPVYSPCTAGRPPASGNCCAPAGEKSTNGMPAMPARMFINANTSQEWAEKKAAK